MQQLGKQMIFNKRLLAPLAITLSVAGKNKVDL